MCNIRFFRNILVTRMNTYKNSAIALFAVSLFALIFPLIEPGLALAANSATVTARQQVTAEIALTVASGAITLSPAIPGLSGGTGDGSTVVTVITGSNTGYYVTLQAAGTVAAMNGETQGGQILDYSATTAETWSDTSAGQASQFGFGITNGTLSSANGATGYGTCSAADSCFSKAPTTSPKTIVNVTAATAAGGDTFTLKFRAHVPANVSPLVPEDFYTATTTLTATMN